MKKRLFHLALLLCLAGTCAQSTSAQTLRFLATPYRVNEGDAVQFTSFETVNSSGTDGGLFRRANPADAGRTHDDKLVFKLVLILASEEGLQQSEDILTGGGMHAQTDDAAVVGEWQHRPIAEVPVQCDQHPALRNSLLENLRIVRTAKADIACLHNLVTERAKLDGRFLAEHLVQEQTHGSSGSGEFGELGVQHALLGESQRRLDVRPRQGGKAAEDGVPRFTGRQLVQDDLHRDARAFDDGAAATDPGIDFNSFLHGSTLPHAGQGFKPPLPRINLQAWRLSC